MLTNSGVTIYHKRINEDTLNEEWDKFEYKKAWFYGGHGAGINKGYQDANDVQVRIPYLLNKDLNIKNFSIGDIIVQGIDKKNIETQQDLDIEEVYNITSINNNNFGDQNNRHIHLGGK